MDPDGIEMRRKRWNRTDSIPIQIVQMFCGVAYIELREGGNAVLYKIWSDGPYGPVNIQKEKQSVYLPESEG